MGYYIYPILSVLLGRFAFKEALSRKAVMASVLAVAGVVCLALAVPNPESFWISPLIGGSFCVYSLLKRACGKILQDPTLGVLLELLFVLPFAVGYLIYLGEANTFILNGY